MARDCFHFPGQILTHGCFCSGKVYVCVCVCVVIAAAHSLSISPPLVPGRLHRLLALLIIPDEILCPDDQTTKAYICLHGLGVLGGEN